MRGRRRGQQPAGPPCPVCRGEEPAVLSCPACSGRGVLLAVGFCPTGWDEVAPGLWVGGHTLATQDGDLEPVVVHDEFDVVVSLHFRDGHGPPAGTEHRTLALRDGPLAGQDLSGLNDLVHWTAEQVTAGRRVLVRCHAGLNRSSLVACLTLVELGWQPGDAVAAVRAHRSPIALFNPDFEALVLAAVPPPGGRRAWPPPGRGGSAGVAGASSGDQTATAEQADRGTTTAPGDGSGVARSQSDRGWISRL